MTACKPVVGKVPPAELVLSQLPAELDDASVVHRREVDEPTSRIAEDDPTLLKLLEGRLDVADRQFFSRALFPCAGPQLSVVNSEGCVAVGPHL